MFNFFSRKVSPVLDESEVEWMLDTFAWAIHTFDSQAFFEHTQLIQPTLSFFPGRVHSVHEKAETIFSYTLKYTGLNHLPFKLFAPEDFTPSKPQRLEETQVKRHITQDTDEIQYDGFTIPLTYNPNQTLKPEDLSASFSHFIAQYAIFQAQSLPPSGEKHFLEGAEILAIVMGFGVMFTNSAFTFRGGCGSCYNPQANRQSHLSELQTLFALALFCEIKGIPRKEATQHLKKHLKQEYKRAIKQIRTLDIKVRLQLP